ncbi:MAG: ImmA/IrrE family metallo-endopeptidase [Azospirillum sp.]|nr:ImmA/IrrE family metallo-endopeptidase [Azospirillum sp.]
MTRVAVAPDMLRWARERAGIDPEELAGRFKKLPEWEAETAKPTLKQLEAFAKAVHVPIGFLFLPQPPEERLPVPDFRTFDSQAITRPSPNLLDTLYACQERQAWYREFAQVVRQPPRPFVGSADLGMAPQTAAEQIRQALGFDIEARRDCPTWTDALRLFIQQADQAGVLVMISGVVLSNNNRKLDPQEFRGFALADPLAPLVFINGSDTKAGQMFTLAHELAHLWLNASGISNASAAPLNGYPREEVWCNAVAAELLVPLAALRPLLQDGEDIDHAMSRLARAFKVSTLVILRRLLDAGWLQRAAFDQAWQDERARLREIAEKTGSGGDFYRTTIARVSRRFTQALVSSTLEGQTLYRDAFRMLGVSKTETFNNLGREVGVIL